MNAILSVLGHDTVGILAQVAGECSKYKANVIDVSQTIIRDYFAMFMINYLMAESINYSPKNMNFLSRIFKVNIVIL